MRKNYFAKLVNYMKNVYHIDRGINKLKDGRVNPKYKTRQVILPLLLGFLLRIESMNELKFMLQENEFGISLPEEPICQRLIPSETPSRLSKWQD